MLVPIQRQKHQRLQLISVPFFLAVVCLVVAVLLDGGSNAICKKHIFCSTQAVDAFSPRETFRQTQTRIESLSFPIWQHGRQSAQGKHHVFLKQLSLGDDNFGVDRYNDVDIPTSKMEMPLGHNRSAKSTRRRFLNAAGGITTALVTTSSVTYASSVETAAIDADGVSFEYTEGNQTAITIPLAFTGQELLIAYKVDGSTFKAVLDTGSPFLMIPGSCGENTRKRTGCYQNQGVPLKSLPPTIEIFDGFQGEVNWRSAPFEFWDVNNNDSISKDQQLQSSDSASITNYAKKKQVVFGVASEAIMGGPGGVFFGMIRDTDARIRPSFLGQTDVRAFRVNLATRPRTLTLSNRDLVFTPGDDAVVNDYIPMTNLLRRRYGDPVGHYTASAQSIYVNGYPLVDTTIDKKSKILVIFDTGVTGMVVSRGLFDEQYTLARKRREKTLFGNVELTFSTALGKESTLRATKPLTTPFDPEQTWKKFPKRREGRRSLVHIIVMGLAFLEDRSLTIDIDGERILVE